jgi:uncharacterized protein (DUF305 family)
MAPLVSRLRSALPALAGRAFIIPLGAAALSAAACGRTPQLAPSITMAPGTGVVGAGSASAIAEADKAAAAFAPADVAFMQGMIPHHAQAVIMARWAPTHGARADVQLLCKRIDIAQTDEIRLMRGWLAERKQFVPDSASTRHVMKMGDMAMVDTSMSGMQQEMLMPGMLTDEQMRQLDAARGPEFDRLFLTDMIQHHRGATSMVRDLFATYGAAQDEIVFKFANDVNVDQTTEIARMQRMLAAVLFQDGPTAP